MREIDHDVSDDLDPFDSEEPLTARGTYKAPQLGFRARGLAPRYTARRLIRELMAAGFSQKEIERYTGIPQPRISLLCTGKRADLYGEYMYDLVLFHMKMFPKGHSKDIHPDPESLPEKAPVHYRDEDKVTPDWAE